MAETRPLHQEALPHQEPEAARPPLVGAGAKLRTILRRSIFWSYERGSWQYDVIVILILAFIFLSHPLFQDQPVLELTNLRHVSGVVELSHDETSHTYQIDARLLESLNAPTERAAETILEKSLNRQVKVKSVEEIRDRKDSQVVLGYRVQVEP
ncbi:MAG: hypothetical protein DMG22_18980 [Acidobacteria bacterium]|nr:MAG: hypothetical protein DMG22_18980 [Acidobacteriota bacterium]